MKTSKSDAELEYAKAFGQMLRIQRERQKITQLQLATKLKLKGNKAISKYEAGILTPSVYQAAKIAEALNITIELNTHR